MAHKIAVCLCAACLKCIIRPHHLHTVSEMRPVAADAALSVVWLCLDWWAVHKLVSLTICHFLDWFMRV